METETSMKIIHQTDTDRHAGMLTELILSISLQIGCWYTVLALTSVALPDVLMIPWCTLFGAFWYLIYRYLPVPRGVIAVSAVCLAAAVFTQADVRILVGCILTSQMTGFGLNKNRVIWPLLSVLVPVAACMVKGGTVDIWYLGLFLLCCGGLFAVQTVRRSTKKESIPCIALHSSHAPSFPGIFLIVMLVVILFYALFFIPQSYRAFPVIEKLKITAASLGEDETEQTDDTEQEHASGSAQSQTQADTGRPVWLTVLLIVLLILILICIAAAAIYEIVMHRRLKKRKAAFGVDYSPETAFDMYRYIDSLYAFDGFVLDPNPYCSLEQMRHNYDAAMEADFAVLAEAVLRLRFGGGSSMMADEEHRKMAEYCDRLCGYIYHKQKRIGKFWMRFIKCYI